MNYKNIKNEPAWTTPLRERKYARTKVALMQEFVNRLRSTRFEEVSIRGVCREVEVSEGTFYNYFPRKVDVIYYYNQLASVYVVFRARQAQKKGPLAVIEAAFAAAAGLMDSPYLFYEVISVLVGEKKVIEPLPIGAPEKEYAFPGCKGIAGVAADPMLRGFFRAFMEQAVSAGVLPKRTDIEEAVIALTAILAGVPLALTPEGFSRLAGAYQRRLALLWKALRSK